MCSPVGYAIWVVHRLDLIDRSMLSPRWSRKKVNRPLTGRGIELNSYWLQLVSMRRLTAPGALMKGLINMAALISAILGIVTTGLATGFNLASGLVGSFLSDRRLKSDVVAVSWSP